MPFHVFLQGLPSRFIRLLPCLVFCLLAPAALSQEAASEAEIESRLTQIRVALNDLKNRLNQAEGEESKLLEELQAQDQRINETGQAIYALQQQIKKSQLQIDALNAQLAEKNAGIENQKNQILELLKLKIYIDHDRTLKLLLLSPDNSAAEITHHQINFLQTRLYSLIGEIAVQIAQLIRIKQDLSAHTEDLLEQQEDLGRQDAQLRAQKGERTVVLKALQKTIRAYRDESDSLSQDRQRLNTLLSQIKNLLTDLPDDLGKNTLFSRLRGQLSKPLSGPIIRAFNALRTGGTRWDGVVIQNDAGQPVNAVAYGRVAFADWLRGYGLLVILDHGDDYLTLYGHNQSILVEPGDWVQADQVIATAGNSGSLTDAGVYFEIRKQAAPQNPVKWFKSP